MTVKEQVRQLWKQCFDDDDAFIDLYFRLRYTDKVNRTVVENGQVLAALQAIPYPFSFCGEVVKSAYISGACTRPDCRNNGLMRRLLRQTHRQMYADGVLISTLIPAEEWLNGYYVRSGYASCFKYGLKRVDREVINRYAHPVENSYPFLKINKMNCGKRFGEFPYTYFNEQMCKRPCGVIHTPEDVRVILADLDLSGGDVWEVRNGDALAGLAFCLESEADTVTVKELLLSSPGDEPPVLEALLRAYRVRQVRVIRPFAPEMHNLGMARIVNVPACLALFARHYTGKDLYLRVEGDEAVPENNGYYVLRAGMSEKRFEEQAVYDTCTISRLTSFVFAGLHPYMSLMLD